MKNPTQVRNVIAALNGLFRSSLWRHGFLIMGIVLSLGWFVLAPGARAVSPPPDGFYSGKNTAEGQDSLLFLSSGVENTALGYEALYHTTTGNDNTAIGAQALFFNTVGGNNTAPVLSPFSITAPASL